MNAMNIYLAARYSRREELCRYREQLTALGHSVPAVWLNGSHQISDNGKPIGEHGEALVEGDSGSHSNEAAALRAKFAHEDLCDVARCDCIINFTEPPRSAANRGGRHVEFGYALARFQIAKSPRLIVVGHRENLFHWFPSVEFYATWEECFSSFV